MEVLRELREAQDQHDLYRGPHDLGLKGAARKARREAIERRLALAKQRADSVLKDAA